MTANAPKFMSETVFEKANANGVDVVLWASRSQSEVSRETSYSGLLTVGGRAVVEQSGIVLADGSAELTTVFWAESGTRQTLKFSMTPEDDGARITGDFDGNAISALTLSRHQFSNLSWSALKAMPIDGPVFEYDNGQPVEMPDMGSTAISGSRALIEVMDASDPNKLNVCALGVMAGAMGVAVATGGAGAGLIIAGQLIATGWCAIP